MKVSMITPVWNRPDMLVRSVHSALTQTHQDFEIIVVGDGCPPDVEKEYKRVINFFDDERICWYNLPEHKVCTWVTTGIWARNLGLKKAAGEFIAPLDDDDVWLPYHLEESLKIMRENPAIDFVYGECWNVGMKGKQASTIGRGMENGFERSLIPHPTAIYRSKFKHLEYPDLKRGGSDRGLWTKIYEAGAKMHFSPKVHAIHYSSVV